MLPLGSNALVFSFAIEIRKDKQNMQCMYNVIRPEESYRLWRVAVCDQVTSYARRLKPNRQL